MKGYLILAIVAVALYESNALPVDTAPATKKDSSTINNTLDVDVPKIEVKAAIGSIVQSIGGNVYYAINQENGVGENKKPKHEQHEQHQESSDSSNSPSSPSNGYQPYQPYQPMRPNQQQQPHWNQY